LACLTYIPIYDYKVIANAIPMIISEGYISYCVAMNETTTAVMPGSLGCAGCANLAAGHCTNRIHSAVTRMIGGRGKPAYVGGLFSAAGYPGFTGTQCVQYVQEYLPFHLPQIEHGLFNAYKAIGATFPADRPVRVLDIGSGPASVALALDCLVSNGKIAGRFIVDTVEPSIGFGQMIDQARGALAGGPVEISRLFSAQLPEWMQYARTGLYKYDWLVMANVLSPLSFALNRDNERLKSLISELLSCTGSYPGGVSVTFIEGNCCTYGHPVERFNALIGGGMRSVGSMLSTRIGAGYILKCRHYRTKQGNCVPHVIMITIKKDTP
jgi:hypothetical protein